MAMSAQMTPRTLFGTSARTAICAGTAAATIQA